MKNFSSLLVIALTAVAMTGCVSKKQFTELKSDYDKLQTEHVDLQGKYNNAKVKIAEYTSDSRSLAARLAEEQKRNEQLQKAYAQLQGSYQSNVQQGNVNISKLVDEINASNKFIKQLVEAKSKSDSLNQALTNKLTRSLSREEMNDVDVQVLKGVVYISLADNMLFKSGCYEISDRAGRPSRRLRRSSRTTRTMMCSWRATPTTCPSRRTNIRNNWDLSACVHRRWCRLCKRATA